MFSYTWSEQYLMYCNDIYTMINVIQITSIWYIAVADRFITTEITYIQVGGGGWCMVAICSPSPTGSRAAEELGCWEWNVCLNIKFCKF